MNLTQRQQWQDLQQHYDAIKDVHMADLFNNDPQRCQHFTLQVADLLLDYSKNRLTTDTLKLLCKLATAVDLPHQINGLFNGAKINFTEQRAALQIALRCPADFHLPIDDENIIARIHQQLNSMEEFIQAVTSAHWRGCSNQPIKDIVNIGIGGSHLGPLMVKQALTAYANTGLRVHFVSNAHEANIAEVLAELNPANTLFIISSKSFATLEMLLNAKIAKQWLIHAFGEETDLHRHFVAVTANKTAAITYGIKEQQIFELWDWVGGRFSVWSSIGLPVALAVGMKNFKDFLAGAHAMDQHFQTAPFEQNMPVIMALLGIWYNNFFQTKSHAIIPYNYHLRYLPAHLQQLDMESNGKSIDRHGHPVTYATGPIIWGEIGTDGQHAFHQLLHQGTQLVPADFIIAINDHKASQANQDVLFASCLSQTRALMQGKAADSIAKEMRAAGKTEQALVPHKVLPGNRPSNTLIMSELNPYNVGMLLALYEHKVVVQGLIWEINSFDQWGVELGKQIANEIIKDLNNDHSDINFDSSTNQLLKLYKQLSQHK